MGLLSFLNPIQSNLTTILGGALALAVLGDVGLGWFAKHEYDAKQKILTVEKTVYQDRVQQVKVIDHENDEAQSKVQQDVSTSIGRDVDALRLRNSTSYGALPNTTEGTTSTSPDGTKAQLLPTVQRWVVTEADEESCVIDYDLAKGWQDWYSATQSISSDNGIPSNEVEKVINGTSIPGSDSSSASSAASN